MRRKRLAVKILVYFAFAAWLGGIVFLLGYRARNPIDSYSDSQSQERPTQKPVTSFQQYDTNPRGEQSDDHQSYASKVFEPITLLTLFLVFGVGITAYIYWRQLKKMEETVALVGKQGKTMEGQLTVMQSTLTAIQRQEAHLKRQADTLDASLVIGAQAYVCIHSVSLDLNTDHIYITVENLGRVPADTIEVDVSLKLEIPPAFKVKDAAYRNCYKYGRATELFPGSLKLPIRIPLDLWLNDIEIRWIRSGDALLTMEGYITFYDGFEPRQPKKSQFAFVYRLRNQQWFPRRILSPEEIEEKKAKEADPN